MGTNISAIFNFLTQPPGDLVFHLVVGLALVVLAIAVSLKISRDEVGQRGKHVWIGSLILLLIQVVLFSLRFSTGDSLLLTSFDRLAGVLTITWLAWTFLEEKQRYLFTGLSVFLTLGSIFIYVVSNLLVILQPGLFSTPDRGLLILWAIFSLVLIVLEIVLIMVNRPDHWAVGAGILLVLALGYGFQLGFSEPAASRMGAVRLAQTLSLPWMLLLYKRLGHQDQQPEPPAEIPLTISEDEKPVDIKPLLIEHLLQIPLQDTSENKFKAVVQAVSLSVISDICYLARVSDDQTQIDLLTGYDLIREEFLPGKTLARAELLHIMDAWEDHKSVLLSDENTTSRDVVTLTLLLRYHRIGNLLAVPLSLPEQPLAGGIILLSPYTSKAWGPETLRLFDQVKDSLARVLFLPNPCEALQEDLDQSRLAEKERQKDIEGLTKTLVQMGSVLEKQESNIKQLKARYQIEKLETVKQLDACQAKINALTAQVAEQKAWDSEIGTLKAEIRQLVDERDQLRTALARANARIKDLEDQSGQTGPIRLSTQNQILSLDSIAANLKLSLASKLQDKDLELQVINPDERQLVKTDPTLLQTILAGLLENAAEASQLGQIIQLTQNLSLETGMLIIQVTDHGEGLTPEEQQELFHADQPRLPGIGSLSGIRESIRAIRLLNGKIWLKSKKHHFTTFRVQLPVRIID